MMKSVGSLLLLLHLAMVTVERCTGREQADIRIIGTETSNFIAGRLEICVDLMWRAVYDVSWSVPEARIVCQGRGFPAEGALGCGNSCFGSSSLDQGYTDFNTCIGRTDLTECGSIAPDGHFPNMNAGIICFRPGENALASILCPQLTTPTSCPECPPCSNTTDCPTSPTPSQVLRPDPTTPCSDPTTPCPASPSSLTSQTSKETTSTRSLENQTFLSSVADTGKNETVQKSTESCRAIGISLGILSALLLLSLMGVVIGWLCSCHRNRLKSREPDVIDVNPSYSLMTTLVHTTTEIQHDPTSSSATLTSSSATPTSPTNSCIYSYPAARDYQEIDDQVLNI